MVQRKLDTQIKFQGTKEIHSRLADAARILDYHKVPKMKGYGPLLLDLLDRHLPEYVAARLREAGASPAKVREELKRLGLTETPRKE